MKNLYDESIMWGTHASVKNIDNKICQKVYEEYTMTTIKDHVIDEWVFNTIKSLDLESLVKLYDYVEKDKLIGETNSDLLYLVIKKDNNFLKYEDYQTGL